MNNYTKLNIAPIASFGHVLDYIAISYQDILSDLSSSIVKDKFVSVFTSQQFLQEVKEFETDLKALGIKCCVCFFDQYEFTEDKKIKGSLLLLGSSTIPDERVKADLVVEIGTGKVEVSEQTQKASSKGDAAVYSFSEVFKKHPDVLEEEMVALILKAIYLNLLSFCS